jgi:hypothetical protein
VKNVDFAFVYAEVNWVLEIPMPTKSKDPVRDDKDDDASWDKNKIDHAPLAYTLENQTWLTGNKCIGFIKSTIGNAMNSGLNCRVCFRREVS